MQQETQKIVPVILSGGSGTRLWPMSREEHPKQFHGLINLKESLMEQTLRRITDPARFYPPVVVGNQAHRFLMADQLKRAGIASPEIIAEPCVRNTAPAITAAALYIRQRYQDALMLVLPTDQHIADCGAFLSGIEQAVPVAERGYLVTFGIAPGYPETGYGYICRGAPISGEAFAVSAFIEKPDITTASNYIAAGDYFWNSGMFLFSSRALLEEMTRLNPDIIQHCREAVDKGRSDKDALQLDSESFSQASNISIDYALMERTQRSAMVALDCGWSDTGAWEALWRISPKNGDGNVVIGDCHPVDSHDCYIRSEKGPVVATYGVDNLVVVATKDAVLVTRKDQAHALKNLIEQIRKDNPRLVAQNSHSFRPWGMFESLDNGPRHQVKRIHVKPGEKLSLQMHYHRAEHWIVVSGTAKVVCDERQELLTENQSIYIPNGSVHRIENPGKIDLEIIEVQSGPYLGEDDIVRLEDQYGRTKVNAA